MSHLNYKQVANVERRRWDVETYEKKATERKLRESETDSALTPTVGRNGVSRVDHDQTIPFKGPNSDNHVRHSNKPEFQVAPVGAIGPEGSNRAFLQARKTKVSDIDERVGSTDIIAVEVATKSSGSSEAVSSGASVTTESVVTKTGVGWHCSVCDCFLKDSHTYLDHINGRKHQRKLGFSMRVERSTEDDLLNKLSSLKNKKKTESEVDVAVNYDKLVQDKDKEERLHKEERQRKRKERRQKLKVKESEPQDVACENDGVAEEDEEESEECYPDMAALMGFSGFGSNKN